MAKSPAADISLRAFTKGCEAYWKYEPRDAMYRIAARLVKDSWGNAGDTADGLGVILLTWNQALTTGRLGGQELVALMHETGRLNDGSDIVYAGGLRVAESVGVPAVVPWRP